MEKDISLFPTLDDDLLKIIKPKVNYKFSYDNNVIEHHIDKNKHITLDNKSDFDRVLNDLNIKVSIDLEECNRLFGTSGIAPTGSSIGVSIEVFSQKSKYRVTEISNDDIDSTNIFSTTFELTIPKNRINGEVDINVLLFLRKSTENLSKNEVYLNNQEGVVLGFVDSKILYLMGNGSIFPIINKKSSDNRLWQFNINYSDPYDDKLSESIELVLNTSNKNFEYLDPNNKKYCEPLINEIVCNSILLLIQDLKDKEILKDDWSAKDYSEGSIMQFMKYLKQVLSVDFSDLASMSTSLHNLLVGGDKYGI